RARAGHYAGQSGLRRQTALLAGRTMDRLPRPEAARVRGRSVRADALRETDGTNPLSDAGPRRMGRGVPVVARLPAHLLLLARQGARGAPPGVARGRRSRGGLERGIDRRAAGL